MSSIRSKSSNAHRRTSTYDSFGLNSKLGFRQTKVSKLYSKLFETQTLTETLNDSYWKLKDQTEHYATMISSEKSRNHELTQAFSEREAALLHSLKDKDSLIKQLETHTKQLIAQAKTSDRRLTDAYHQFAITKNSLNQQIRQSAHSIQLLSDKFASLQAAVTASTQQISTVQSQTEAAKAMIVKFQSALCDKNEQLRRDRVKSQETKTRGRALAVAAKSTNFQLVQYKKQCVEEQLHSLRLNLT